MFELPEFLTVATKIKLTRGKRVGEGPVAK